VSSVFDFARQIMILEWKDGTETNPMEILIDNHDTHALTAVLLKHKVDVLICGAISSTLQSSVIHQGIQVIPFVSGQVREVIHAFQHGTLETSIRYKLPGCGKHKGYGRRRLGQCNKQNNENY